MVLIPTVHSFESVRGLGEREGYSMGCTVRDVLYRMYCIGCII